MLKHIIILNRMNFIGITGLKCTFHGNNRIDIHMQCALQIINKSCLYIASNSQWIVYFAHFLDKKPKFMLLHPNSYSHRNLSLPVVTGLHCLIKGKDQRSGHSRQTYDKFVLPVLIQSPSQTNYWQIELMAGCQTFKTQCGLFYYMYCVCFPQVSNWENFQIP